MKNLDVKALVAAATEFNKVIVLDPQVVNPKDEPEVLGKTLAKAVRKYREPEDKFSKETEKVFKQLAEMYPKKDKSEKEPEKGGKKEKATAKAGDVVEMKPDGNKVKKDKSEKEVKKEKVAEKPVEKPKKEKGAEPKVGNVVLIKTILDRQVKKDELENLIKNEAVFADHKKKLLKETNFMSLKKKMLEVFPEAEVKALRAEMPPIPHEKKAEPEKKDSALVKGIKESTKVKELKSIAKANDQFNWKKLKKLEEFEAIQKAMLKVAGGESGKSEKKAEPTKPKMIANPLIAAINAFEKLKKLRKWVEETASFPKVKAKKFDDVDELKAALIASIPAEIEAKSGKSGGKSTGKPRSENVAHERREFIIPLLKEAKYTRPELKKMLDEKFGEDTPASHPHSNMLSEIKNEKYYAKYNLGGLVEENKKGFYRFVKN